MCGNRRAQPKDCKKPFARYGRAVLKARTLIDVAFAQESSLRQFPVLKRAGVKPWRFKATILVTMPVFAIRSTNNTCCGANGFIHIPKEIKSDMLSQKLKFIHASIHPVHFGESRCYRESRCLFRFRARMRKTSKTFSHAGRGSPGPGSIFCQSYQFFSFVWGGRTDRAAIFFTPFPSPEESTDAGLNQPPLWDNPTFPFTAMVAEGRVNEEYLLRKNANPMHEVAWLLMLQCDGLQESCSYHESCCLFRLGVRRRDATSTLCHAACWKSKHFPWCVASFADLWGIPSFSYRTQQSPVQRRRTHMPAGPNQWPRSHNHSLKTSILADQINE